MTRNKRGKEYIDPQVQGALWRRMVLHWLAFILVALLLAVGLEWMSDPFQPVLEVITRAWWTYSPMLLVLGCLIPLFVYDSIRLSHRFAGPIFRLRQVIHSLASGSRPERVEFRDNDFWKEIAADMNQVIDRLGNTPANKEEPGA
ncbi:hypothetical protein NG895_15215 [Aeoliella sp. ICT_H6.2]|uniref:HAMP domain-containing protein n=1 Tax=Aeoliella straminimaris TaxID=2954799 RepID=A0A9X2FA80_9BACT|nr:hypothetical protein [Aeoliella straminimaris]MCO6045260.1 hypothetical protein [Aeoliella straminimaris]